jgi:hypothetical protein
MPISGINACAVPLYLRFVKGLDLTGEELVKKIKELLETYADLDFLLDLKKKDLEKLLACIRGRLDQVGNNVKR